MSLRGSNFESEIWLADRRGPLWRSPNSSSHVGLGAASERGFAFARWTVGHPLLLSLACWGPSVPGKV